MYDEVKAYRAAIAAAEERHDAGLALLPPMERHAGGVDCANCEGAHVLSKTLREAGKDAWDALTASTNPLVRWIAENCWDYHWDALEILEALPATMAELDAIALQQGWCDTWDCFRADARAAGVLPVTAPDAEVPA